MANQYVRRAEKAVKKTHPATLLIALLFLIIGLIGGGFAAYMALEGRFVRVKGRKNRHSGGRRDLYGGGLYRRLVRERYLR